MLNPISLTVNYVKSSIAELKKVTWPTKDQTIRYSVLVISVSVAVAVFFASLDLGFSSGVMYAISKTPHSSAPALEAPIVPDLEEVPPTEAAPEEANGTINVTSPETTTESAPEQMPTVELPASNEIQLPSN